MRRFLLLSLFFVAATLLACDEDVMAPVLTTGSITLNVTVDDLPAISQQAVSAEVVSSPATGGDTSSTAVASVPAFESDRGDGPRISEYKGTRTSSNAAIPQAESADGPAKAPEEASAIDAATIRIIGPTTRTLTNQTPGTTVTVEDLDVGTYTVVLEGLVSGEVDYFGRTQNISVTAGNNSTANISFNSFRPVIQAVTSPTTDMAILFTWNVVQGATGYYVELDTDPGFTSPVSATVDTEAAVATMPSTGIWYVRASSVNQYVPRGRAGDAQSVDIVTDIDPSGTDFASAYDLGFAATGVVYSQLNVVPSADEDWYTVEACLGDRIIAEVYAQRLDPPSDLNSYLELYGPTGNSVDVQDDNVGTDSRIDRVLTSGGQYYIKVAASGGGSTGNYQLSIDVEAGSANDGSSCSTLPGATNGWTGSSSTDPTNWSDPDNWLTGAVPTSTDTISIPAGAAPVLTENVTVASLIIEVGGHVDTDVYDITVTGDLAAGNSITGDGQVILTGTDVYLSGGVPHLYVLGDVSLAGRAFATGTVQVDGTLRMNGFQMAVGS